MTDQQRADLQARTNNANRLNDLATKANGHGATSVQRRQARQTLENEVGARRADRLQEDALVRAGAAPRGLRRWFG